VLIANFVIIFEQNVTVQYDISYDMMHDLHWKTGRQAARLIYHIN